MTKIHRNDVEVSKLTDDIFNCVVHGLTKNEIMNKFSISERTYELYIRRIQDRLIAQESEQRKEDVLYYKKICKERLTYALRGLQSIADNQKTTPRTRMDSFFRYGEISMLIFRLEVETGNWLSEYSQMNLPSRMVPASEIIEEEEYEQRAEQLREAADPNIKVPPPERFTNDQQYDIPDLDDEEPL